jgi:glucokinase
VRPADLAAVCVVVPRVVEFATGRVVKATRRPQGPTNGAVELPLTDVPLRERLGERLGVPAFVDNSANAVALAEAHSADLVPLASELVLLAVGRRISAGLVLGGRVYRGATGAAGELGHSVVGLDLAGAVPSPMRFPQTGSLEFVAAGHALDRLADQAARVNRGSALGALRSAGKEVLGADAIEAARAGDAAASRMIDIWGQRIGIGVANAVNTFDPEEVVIAGDAAAGGDLLLEPVRRVARGYTLPGVGARTIIRLARHGGRAPVLGAALIARDELER